MCSGEGREGPGSVRLSPGFNYYNSASLHFHPLAARTGNKFWSLCWFYTCTFFVLGLPGWPGWLAGSRQGRSHLFRWGQVCNYSGVSRGPPLNIYQNQKELEEGSKSWLTSLMFFPEKLTESFPHVLSTMKNGSLDVAVQGRPELCWRSRPGQADVCTLFVGLIARSDVGRAWQKPEEAGVIALLVLLYLTSLLTSYRQSLSLSVVLWHPHYDESSETIFLVYWQSNVTHNQPQPFLMLKYHPTFVFRTQNLQIFQAMSWPNFAIG